MKDLQFDDTALSILGTLENYMHCDLNDEETEKIRIVMEKSFQRENNPKEEETVIK